MLPSQTEVDRLLRLERMGVETGDIIQALLAEEEPRYSPAGTRLPRDMKRAAMLNELQYAMTHLIDAGARYRAYLYLRQQQEGGR